MNLENIVTSLELSQKLDETGVGKASIFVWIVDTPQPVVVLRAGVSHYYYMNKYVSAFTAQELWDMIDHDDDFNLDWWLNKEDNIADCLAQLIIVQHEDKQ